MSIKIHNRIHRAYAKRISQISLNLLSFRGGRDYISRRLWRAPNESDISWNGRSKLTQKSGDMGAFGMVGRVDRATLVNDAARVVNKINQYLFKEDATRQGIDEEWAKDVTGYGQSISSFWQDVSENFTVSQWVWLQVSTLPALKDENGNPVARNHAQKLKDRDYPRWKCWPSASVPDWSFGENGKLVWIITEEIQYDNSNPYSDASEKKVRTLWHVRDGGVYYSKYISSAKEEPEVLQAETFVPGITEIPFVIIGRPSCEPWWFDDVENMQAQIMNLDSLNVENLIRAVFPQLVIPASLLNSLEMKIEEVVGAVNGSTVTQVIRELVRSSDNPIAEDVDDKGTTRFITPNASDLKLLPEEIERKRKVLFEMVGLSLFSKETRQTQTAESKQFDQLDTESTLKHRALIMQETETKLVELSKEIDSGFKGYTPVWPNSFDVVDIANDMGVITMAGNLPDTTPAIRKLVLKALVRVIANISGRETELIEQASLEIDAMEFIDEFSENDHVHDDVEPKNTPEE